MVMAMSETKHTIQAHVFHGNEGRAIAFDANWQ
jgi:hypothetical protein